MMDKEKNTTTTNTTNTTTTNTKRAQWQSSNENDLPCYGII